MKFKKRKQIISWLLTVTVIAMYLFISPVGSVNAVSSIYNAKDLISDSDFGVTASHSLSFTTATTTKQNDYFRFVFPVGFTTVGAGSETCMFGSFVATSTAAARMIDCTYAGVPNLGATTTQSVFTGITNPLTENTLGYSIYVRHYSSAGLLKEQVELKVYILSSVVMTAHVNAILSFTVSGVASGQTVNGVTCDNTTTATTTDFGTLAPTASTTVCQQLQVATNASDGYIVTVEQDHELLSSSGDNINSFRNSTDNTGSSTPALANVWTGPTSILDQDWTYGHMGFTSNDQNLNTFGYVNFYQSGGNPFYAGFNSAAPVVVMHHNHPTTNNIQNAGLARVAYTAEVGVLQQAGDYQNQLTYIATATY